MGSARRVWKRSSTAWRKFFTWPEAEAVEIVEAVTPLEEPERLKSVRNVEPEAELIEEIAEVEAPIEVELVESPAVEEAPIEG